MSLKKNSKFKPDDDSLIEKVKPYVAQKMGRIKIREIFGTTDRQARRLVDRARKELDQDSKPAWVKASKKIDYSFGGSETPSKAKKTPEVDKVRGWLDQEFDSYEIAKLKQTSPATTRTLIRKAQDTYNPTPEWVVKAAHKGIRLSELKEELGIKSLKRAKEIVEENFPNCYLSIHELTDDTFIIPIDDSSCVIEELQVQGTLPKRFKYSVSLEEDYLHVKFDNEIEADSLEIYNLSDIHYGSMGHRPELFNKYLDLIESKPNAFALIGGDLGEFLTKTSVGHEMDAYIDNSQQILGVVKKLKRIAHKVLDWVYSNHDDGRSEKTFQARMGQVMAGFLGVPYFRQGVYIDVEWRGQTKTIYHTHGFERAHEESRIVAEIKKMRAHANFSVDAYMLGHTHKAWFRREEVFNKTPGRGMSQGEYWIINSGSTLAWRKTYAQRAVFGPTPQDLTFLTISESGLCTAQTIPVRSL